MELLTALIGNAGGVVPDIVVVAGAIIITLMQLRHGKRLKDIQHKAGTAAEQTANSHDKNLRDEIDDNHKEVVQLIRQQNTRLNNMDRRINNIAQVVGKGSNVRRRR